MGIRLKYRVKYRVGMMLLAAWFTLSLLPVYAMAKDASFSLAVSNSTSIKGNQVVVTVTGSDLTDVYGFEINLKYDTNLLLYKKSESLLPGFSVPLTPADGLVVFAHTKVGKVAGLSGKAELAAITFEVIGKNTEKPRVELTRVKLVKSDLTDTVVKPGTKADIAVQAAGNTVAFKDIANHWAKEGIERAVSMGFVNGFGDGTFRPDVRITRAEFVVMTARAFDFEAKGAMPLNFRDVDTIPVWARDYIAEAEQTGLIKGYADGSFRPNQWISRSEMAVLIMRLYDGGLHSNEMVSFADKQHIKPWALPSVASAVDLGIIKGKNGHRFAPNDPATRAEALIMLLRLMDAEK
ncbi:S-layer homology domain-containing protein [Paenibacillus sp. FSL H7-0756]|uniref:S-layer homology domain-containing protein n=1 Tax=Paenibacillus sp. FSL H7-0756 TaxID=2954738 RepID=UPI0030FBCF46